jgi:hypothetical protein
MGSGFSQIQIGWSKRNRNPNSNRNRNRNLSPVLNHRVPVLFSIYLPYILKYGEFVSLSIRLSKKL